MRCAPFAHRHAESFLEYVLKMVGVFEAALVRPVLVKTTATNSLGQAVSPASADAIMRMLKSPITSTVQMCEHDSETGRSVYSPTNYIASCVGFHPVEKPEYVIVVSFTKPRTAHTGDEVAKPAWSRIADKMSLQKTR